MIGKYPRTRQLRELRRERAVTVQDGNQRTPQEQLANLDARKLVAAKERAKIAKKLSKAADEAAQAKANAEKKAAKKNG